MADQRRYGRREERRRAKLQEAGVGALAFGAFMLLGPAFLPNPMGRTLAVGLQTPGWLLLFAGIAILTVHKLTTKADAPTTFGAVSQRSAAQMERVDPRLKPSASNTSAACEYTEANRQAELTGEPPAMPARWGGAVFDVIEWRRFEAVCEALFGQAGFETKSQSHGADGGIDIWLYSKHQPDGPVSVVQCKHWSSKPVPVLEMRALLGSMTDKKVKRGIFATTSTFTAEAQQVAKANGIHLLDRTGLVELILSRTPEQQASLLAIATQGQFWVPTCPSCGVKMVHRKAKTGSKQFWGCVNFPECRTTING